MKRPAAAKVIEPATKAAKKAEPKNPIDIVIEALRNNDVKSPANMLISMLPFAAEPPPRHHFQDGTLDLIQKELQAQEAAMKSCIAQLHATVAGVDVERDRRSAAVAAASADVEAKTELHSSAKAALGGVQQETPAVRKAAAAARAAQKEGDAELDKAGEKQRILTAALEEKTSLEGAEGSASELGPRAEQLRANLALVILDTGLLNASHKAFSKPEAERAVFDKMVTTQLSEEIDKSLKAAQQVIAEGMPGKITRAQTVQECESALQAAVERQCNAEMAESNANAGKQEAASTLKAAKDSLALHPSEVEAAAAEVSQAEMRLAEFQAGALQAFADLRDPEAKEAAEKAAKAAARAALDAELDAQVAALNAKAEADAAAKAAEEAAAAEAAAAEAASAEAAAAEAAAAEAAAAEAAAAQAASASAAQAAASAPEERAPAEEAAVPSA